MSGYDKQAVATVERGLDRLVTLSTKRGVDVRAFNREIVARLAGVAPDDMSNLLQLYRSAQPIGGVTKYVIAAEGYGRAARWKILAKPGSDPKSVQQARLDHAAYLAKDSIERTVRDYVTEVEPALTSKQRDQVIAAAQASLLGHLRVDVDTAINMLVNVGAERP